MATTTNYGWTTPDDTALVKDGAAAIRTLGSSIDSTVFSNASAGIPKTIVDAKGDLIAATASDTVARVAVGTNGQVLVADSTAATGVAWATPVSGSITWTPRQGRQSNFAINQIAYNGSNLYVAIAASGGLFTSPDGVTWTSRTSGFGSNGIFAVAFGNGTWVIGGANGTMATSTDGITWTSRTSGFGTNIIRSIVYGNALWVAVGQNARITTSTDLSTWTERGTSGAGTIWSVIYANSMYVAVGAYSTNNIFYSSNGTSWTSMAAGTAELVYVYYYSGQYVAYTSSGVNTGYYSTDATSWTNFNTFSTSSGQGLKTNQNQGAFYYALNYLPNGVLPRIIYKVSAAIDTTAGYPQFYYQPIDVPRNYSGVEVSCIFVNSSGGFIIADSQGRIWTSF
jgi:hypothetical protein